MRIEFDTPADDSTSGISGRVGAQEILQINAAGHKRLTLSGSYTATSSNAAKAQYDAAIAAYASAAQTRAGGGTWELVSENPQWSDHDTRLSFTNVYRELKFNQSVGTLNNTSIFNADLIVRRGRVAPGDTDIGENTKRAIEVDVSYRCWVVAGTDMRTTWSGTILPHIVAHVRTVTSSTVVALIDSSPAFDDQEQRIDATLKLVVSDGSKFLKSLERTRDDVDLGVIYSPVWDGDVYARDAYPGPEVWIRTIVRETSHIGKASEFENPRDGGDREFNPFGIFDLNAGAFQLEFGQPRAGRAAGGGGDFNSGLVTNNAGFVKLGEFRESTPLRIGVSPYQIDVVNRITGIRLMRVNLKDSRPDPPQARRGPITQPGAIHQGADRTR